MRLIGLAVVLALSFALAPLAAEAQQTGKTSRVGVLLSRYGPKDDPPQGLRQRLRDLGYIEGQNLTIEWRTAEGGYGRLSELAAELVSRQVDVLVADTALATRAAMAATQRIPIVTALAADPIGDGLVSNVVRPGGNVTGISLMLPELSPKRLELLKEAVPKASRIAVLWNPSTPWHTTMLRQLHGAALSLKLELVPVAVQGPREFEAAFAAIARQRTDGIFWGDNPIFSAHQKQLLELVAKVRLPMIASSREWVVAGGLISYGPIYVEMFRSAAVYVDKILKGTKPADLPIEQPTKFELVINLKTAKALGLTIPQTLLLQADQVIE
jgi:putative tryptophan/tyrosine transport system substrate-binding protein